MSQVRPEKLAPRVTCPKAAVEAGVADPYVHLSAQFTIRNHSVPQNHVHDRTRNNMIP